MQQLPLNGRNLTQLAVIASGCYRIELRAYRHRLVRESSRTNCAPGGTTIEANGARDSANKLLLDGVDNTEMIAQTQIVRPSVESLQEFNVITSNAGPEFNRGAGAILVTSTRSGSNNLHGSVYEYIRNSDLDLQRTFLSGRIHRFRSIGSMISVEDWAARSSAARRSSS